MFIILIEIIMYLIIFFIRNLYLHLLIKIEHVLIVYQFQMMVNLLLWHVQMKLLNCIIYLFRYNIKCQLIAIGHLHTKGVTSVKWSPDDKQV